MTGATIDNRSQWPLRPWLLGIALGLTGLLIWLVGNGQGMERLDPWRAAVIGFLFFGSIAAVLSVERINWPEPLVFAGIAGLVMAGLAWRAAMGGDAYADPQYGFFAGVVATLLALPLFQAGFHRTRFGAPYPAIHEAAWTDALALAGALAFTGAAWLVIALLAALFHLLKLDFLRDLMKQDWFGWTWSGAAFGAALGVLRNETAILATLQRVAMVVLSILAVPLAAGLALFLVAMVVSGPAVLWQATRSATPVLLLCAAGAWLLANAIIRDSDEAASASPILRVAAMVLALTVLPLTVFAAVSMGTRVAQHGLSPERIWGLVAIAAACAYGFAWLVAILRGWKGGAWHARLRQANLHLTLLVCALALILALPIFDFGAVSTRNQLARLESGRVTPAQFDYAALRWDFGPAGKRALADLAKSKNVLIAGEAKRTLAMKSRYPFDDQKFAGRTQVWPQGATAPATLLAAIRDASLCTGDSLCRIYLQPDRAAAVVFNDSCARPGWTAQDAADPAVKCSIAPNVLRLADGKWGATGETVEPSMTQDEERRSLARERAALDAGSVRIAPASLMQVYIGDEPVGQPFDPAKTVKPPLEGRATRR
ncbi:DUF4153 domain-containing protein [Porphyrobacter algicida]|uniref:DUF4153 domain-containing protein n=1 Tax=Qipengyuania algicida TaxID=1836209 RepID=A0A845AED6_9SPHN|nr:DUF4153 domain-containing protein [Qipengyuania algicida]MXP27583.1 DUF4153 domain-containing protein [Qipengyuania algicida]